MSDGPRPDANLLRVAYDGTAFHGFARQEGLRTVQGELEAVLSELHGDAVTLRGASRTDAGVHARGQIVAYDPPKRPGPPPERVRPALWGRTPADLEVMASWSARPIEPGPLHPRRHNLGKHYRYRIRCARGRDPLSSRYEWSLGRPLALEAMREAAARFVGEHDFGSFRAAGCQAQSTLRRIDAVELRSVPAWVGVAGDMGAAPRAEHPEAIEVHVHGSAFLMHMVRIMVGTLVEVGLGRLEATAISGLLATPDRKNAGPTAPARGLTLEEVKWPEAWPPAGVEASAAGGPDAS